MAPGGSAAQGAQIQIQAAGNLDAWTTLNPECTHFQQEYCRHTPFAITESDISSNSTARWGATLQYDIPRAGDLLGPMFLQYQVNGLRFDYSGPPADDFLLWVPSVAYAAISNCILDIGSITVDQMSGEFMYIIEQYSSPAGNTQGAMIGDFDNISDLRDFTYNNQIMYAALKFFNFDHPELYIPLIALSAHAIRLKVYLLTQAQLVNAFGPSGSGPNMGIDILALPAGITIDPVYNGQIVDILLTIQLVFLDQFERNLVSAEVHELLFIQHQEDTSDTVQALAKNKTTILSFNNSLLAEWHSFLDDSHVSPANFATKDYFDCTVPRPAEEQPPWLLGTTVLRKCPIATFNLRFNSNDRVAQRDNLYFTEVIPFLRAVKKERTRSYLMYAYHFRPLTDYQAPHGECNFSRYVISQFPHIVNIDF